MKPVTRKQMSLILIKKVLNEKTGALEEEIFRQVKPRRQLHKEFCMVDQEGLKWLLKQGLKPSDMRITVALVASCEWANIVSIGRRDLMDLADVSEGECSTSLRRLEGAGVLSRYVADSNRFQLNPSLCWRGAVQERHNALIRWATEQSLAARAPQSN